MTGSGAEKCFGFQMYTKRCGSNTESSTINSQKLIVSVLNVFYIHCRFDSDRRVVKPLSKIRDS